MNRVTAWPNRAVEVLQWPVRFLVDPSLNGLRIRWTASRRRQKPLREGDSVPDELARPVHALDPSVIVRPRPTGRSICPGHYDGLTPRLGRAARVHAYAFSTGLRRNLRECDPQFAQRGAASDRPDARTSPRLGYGLILGTWSRASRRESSENGPAEVRLDLATMSFATRRFSRSRGAQRPKASPAVNTFKKTQPRKLP